jgi:DNA-binding NtrC family response regulator
MSQRIPCVLLVERDIIVRSPLAEYLRECGYRVLEAVNTIEARQLLSEADAINLVLADADAPEDGGFVLRAWIRENYPTIEVILAGSVEKAVEKAGDICRDGPAISKPYHHQFVLDAIQSRLAARDRNQPGRSGGQAHASELSAPLSVRQD